MYKRLDDTALTAILEAGIDEFALNGLDRASMSAIARRAGVSVGVIYKYYADKDSFFLACVRHSLELLDSTLKRALAEGTDTLDCMRRIVRALIVQAREHSNYNVMYNEITSGSCRRYAAVLAREIEAGTAEIYRALMDRYADETGQVLDTAGFAFFFDNLLMMLQFSYSCDYYRERLKLFCGEDMLHNDERMTALFTRFMSGALEGRKNKEEVDK